MFNGWQLLAQQVQFFTPPPENRSELVARQTLFSDLPEPPAKEAAIGHSKSEEMHDEVIGTLIERENYFRQAI